MNESISVVIPCYNHSRYLQVAIDSVFRQSVPNIQLIVVDDGSKDDSVELLQQLAKRHQFQLICQENRGAHNTINRAIEASTGDYVSILNSDDFYKENRLAVLLDVARRENASFLYSAVAFVDESSHSAMTHKRAQDYSRIVRLAEGAKGAAQFFPGNVAITTSNFFFSKALWKQVGPFRNLRYAHDWDWALRAASIEMPCRVDQQLVSYRVHSENTLSEGDVWRHISENAFIFASHIRRHQPRSDSFSFDEQSRQFLALMLKNDSFLPIATLMFLLAMDGVKEEGDVLDKLANGGLSEEVRKLVQSQNLPLDMFLSAQHIESFLPGMKSGGNPFQIRRKLGSLLRKVAHSIERP